MEDSLVPLVNDPLVTSQAGRRAEGAAANTTGELFDSWQNTQAEHGEIRKRTRYQMWHGAHELFGTGSSEQAG